MPKRDGVRRRSGDVRAVRQPPDTADAQLERILHILAAAAAAGRKGVPLEELADTLGTSVGAVLDDISQLEERDFYHPAGALTDVVIMVGGGRVVSWGKFEKLTRLTLREAAAVGLALRARAAEAPAVEGEVMLRLARALETRLASVDPEHLVRAFGLDPADGAAGGMKLLIERAVEERRAVEIQYFKPGGEAPAARVIHPYALACSEGRWYAIAHCTLRGEVRLFRLDRILHARELVGTGPAFERPVDFDARAYVSGGRVYHSSDDVEAVVRYSAAVAGWVLEEGPAESLPDGGVRVRYQVADPRWLVRLVLRYAGEAEVETPPELRTAVAEAASRMCG